MDVPRFSYSPVEGHLGSFQSLMIVEGFHIGESTVKKKITPCAKWRTD